jgi:hypothetical protein
VDEETYFVDNTIKITSEWVKLGGKSYPTAEITSVRMRSLHADTLRELPTFLVIAGSFLMFALINIHYVFPTGWEGVLQLGAVIGMLLSVAGLVMLVLNTLMKTQCLYVVQLSGNFGDIYPFASDDAVYVRSIVSAIRTALAGQLAQAGRPHGSLVSSA